MVSSHGYEILFLLDKDRALSPRISVFQDFIMRGPGTEPCSRNVSQMKQSHQGPLKSELFRERMESRCAWLTQSEFVLAKEGHCLGIASLSHYNFS